MRENVPRRGRLGFGSTQTVGSVVNALLDDFWRGQQDRFLRARYSISFPSASAKCVPQQGLSRRSNRVTQYLSLIHSGILP